MSIVLREHEWAANAIRFSDLGKKPSETLQRVARYFIDKGYSKTEVRNMLDRFILQCDAEASLPKWSDSLDRALSRALKYSAIHIDSIPITHQELDIINSLNGKQVRRLSFTLLCLSKYWRIVNPNCNGWVKTSDNEIMAMANINTSVKRQSAMYGYLRELGMINFSKRVDNTSVQVCFDREGDVAINITDFRNLGYQYLRYMGGSFIECQNCGITTKLSNPTKGRNQKYCKDCSTKVAVQQRIESVMRRRKEDKAKNVEKTKSL